jgi:hypothetical protein
MKKVLVATAAAAMGLTLVCSAATIVSEQFEGGGTAGWNLTDDNFVPPGAGAPLTGGLVGNPGNAIGVTVNTPDPPPYTDRIFANSGSSGGAFTGDYSPNIGPYRGVQVVSFDFYSYSASAPSQLSLFFTSTNDPGVVWYYFVGATQPNSWVTHSAAMQYTGGSSGWFPMFGVGNWAAAVANIDRIGIEITYITGNGQEYRIDNFNRGYFVPEPGTFAALGFAFASLGVTFRRRLNGAVEQLKARFKK